MAKTKKKDILAAATAQYKELARTSKWDLDMLKGIVSELEGENTPSTLKFMQISQRIAMRQNDVGLDMVMKDCPINEEQTLEDAARSYLKSLKSETITN